MNILFFIVNLMEFNKTAKSLEYMNNVTAAIGSDKDGTTVYLNPVDIKLILDAIRSSCLVRVIVDNFEDGQCNKCIVENDFISVKFLGGFVGHDKIFVSSPCHSIANLHFSITTDFQSVIEMVLELL